LKYKDVYSHCHKLLSWGLCLWVLSSCKPGDDPDDPIVASVDEAKLKRSELIDMLPEDYDLADSATLADQLVKKWITEKAVLSLAEDNLSESQKDFSSKLEDYRNSLLIYAYERELVNQKLDTLVSDEEIETFFNENIENFKLKNFILKVWFIEVSAEAPRRRKLISWFKSDKDEDWEKLDDYCKKFAEYCFFEGDRWIYIDDLVMQVPLSVSDWGNFLNTTSYYEFEKDGKLYLLRIFDHVLRGETAPLDLEKEKVRNLIINKRKVDLVKKMRKDALSEAYAEKKVTWVKEQ